MCFKVPVDVALLEELGLPDIYSGKRGIRRALLECIDAGVEGVLGALTGPCGQRGKRAEGPADYRGRYEGYQTAGGG